MADCQSCAGLECAVCIAGRYLIGTSLCISGCSSSQVYNSVNKICDTVVVPSGGGTTTTSVNSIADIKFIPLPFFILMVVGSVLVGILHFRGKVAVVPVLYGLAGGLLTLGNVTVLIVVGVSAALTTALASAGFYCLIVGQVLVLAFSIISLTFWYTKIRGEKWGVALSSLLHYALLAWLTSNYHNYNSYFII